MSVYVGLPGCNTVWNVTEKHSVSNFRAELISSCYWLQCKEQSDLMLEHSCLTVENAAKGGGVYPEVLFQVAKYWYELYMRVSCYWGETVSFVLQCA
jgi:hypothetical protein